MMRNKPSSSMQKTYDECYLICSTAVYFEGQDNEVEALRSWRTALDQICYHNAYKVPQNYRPKSETEKALQDALRDMEIQCKERIDLLEALRQSRVEAKKSGERFDSAATTQTSRKSKVEDSQNMPADWIAPNTNPYVKYPNLSQPTPPPLPLRTTTLQNNDSHLPMTERSQSSPQISFGSYDKPYPPPKLPVPPKVVSRTPSPEKKGRMLTTLRGNKDGKASSKSSSKASTGRRAGPPAASSKAAGLAWDSISRSSRQNGSTTTLDCLQRGDDPGPQRASSFDGARLISCQADRNDAKQQEQMGDSSFQTERVATFISPEPSYPTLDKQKYAEASSNQVRNKSPIRPKAPIDHLSYRTEYQPTSPSARSIAQSNTTKQGRQSESAKASTPVTKLQPPREKSRDLPSPRSGVIARRPLAKGPLPRSRLQGESEAAKQASSESTDDDNSSGHQRSHKTRRSCKSPKASNPIASSAMPPFDSVDHDDDNSSFLPLEESKDRIRYIQEHLPKGVDENAAKQIFNDIVVRGDEVHWDDVAGLDAAKEALMEAVVYPFLRPDIFMGLREPARGMLLFGPPGTGKTMLARAVATESRSTFFAILPSTLTSKWLGESEKLVRALFSLAKSLAPSIIFVDEIDSLLSSRGGSGEHESTRRIKNEFLTQWSDLQRAAAGKMQSDKEKQEGDPSRVLVLAATNLPWAIDEAARRRFVRRQYIPLPESHVRATQLRTLLGHQKHNLDTKDIEVLVELTEGFSGSDITALAKDAAMGPLRSLGKAIMHIPMDKIRPIQFEDFEASLINIRPSVSQQGLQQYEDWAKEFGERGG